MDWPSIYLINLMWKHKDKRGKKVETKVKIRNAKIWIYIMERIMR